MATRVLVDFSNFANIAWYPALAAENAGKENLAKHKAECQRCGPEEGALCDDAAKIPQYVATEVMRTNLALKIEGIRKEVGVAEEKWFFVKDGHATAKRSLFAAYKANRDPGRFNCRPLAESYLRADLAKGASWVVNEEHEADDTIASFAVALAAQGEAVIVVSSDKDLWQLLTHPNIRILNPTSKEFIGLAQIEKAFGLSHPRGIALHKTLFGDSGDNVPNATPRMQKGLVPLIEASDGSLADFLARAQGAQLTPRCRELLTAGMPQIFVNDQLVRLNLTVEPHFV